MTFLSIFGKKARTPSLPKLQLRNTLSGDLVAFEPLSAPDVKMYNCGPTVYDRQHIGNLRPYIFADVLRRTLELWNYRVKQVINITDVGHLTSDADEGDDKVEVAAKKRGLSAQDIAREVTEWFFDDLDSLGIDRERILWPRATEFIPEQIALVETLCQKGYAYKLQSGIAFDTARFPAYGKLGGISLSGQKAGARIEADPEKHNPHDFWLWKFSLRKKRQQEWPSPWGVGFPGWHLECTAMIFKLLGRQIDIHTGGVDHIPVHHNNEIAQAEAATGKRYVKYWLHNEFITIEGKKISKSLGNTIYLYNLVEKNISPRALRYWYLTGHYRSPMNFTWEAIEAANTALNRLYRHFFEELAETEESAPDAGFIRDMQEALAHDLDTPRVIARMWDLIKDTGVSPVAKRASLLAADDILRLGFSEPRATLKLSVIDYVIVEDLPPEIQVIVRERESARAAKDFAKADKLRRQIEAAGYEIADSAQGSSVLRRT